jgi:site-specific DNA-methyltransferase (adenine-specific)
VIEPYFADGQAVLYLGDCREVLPQLDVDYVGVVVADPPYGETSLQWDRWQAGWVAAVAEAVRASCSVWCFGSMRMFLQHADEFAAWQLAQDIVWEKHNGSSSAADRFKRVHEHVLQWYRGDWAQVWRTPVTTPDATARQVRRKTRPPQWGEIGGHTYRSVDGGPRLARSVLRVRSCHGHALHPTQKPLGIIDPLLRYSLAPGGTVLDPFAGAGSTLVAAREAGFRAIGIEADERYAEAAAQRLAQGSLFATTDDAEAGINLPAPDQEATAHG